MGADQNEDAKKTDTFEGKFFNFTVIFDCRL